MEHEYPLSPQEHLASWAEATDLCVEGLVHLRKLCRRLRFRSFWPRITWVLGQTWRTRYFSTTLTWFSHDSHMIRICHKKILNHFDITLRHHSRAMWHCSKRSVVIFDVRCCAWKKLKDWQNGKTWNGHHCEHGMRFASRRRYQWTSYSPARLRPFSGKLCERAGDLLTQAAPAPTIRSKRRLFQRPDFTLKQANMFGMIAFENFDSHY